MGRTGSTRQLKRVGGEVHLAQIKIDARRPTTSGAPLKRCSNQTNINLQPGPPTRLFYSSNYKTKDEKKKEITISPGSSSTANENELHMSKPEIYDTSSITSTSQNLEVPQNSMNSSKNHKYFSKDKFRSVPVCYKQVNVLNESFHRIPRTSNAKDDDSSSLGATLSKFTSFTTHQCPKIFPNDENIASRVDKEVTITTATSLGLRGSDQELQTSPSEWSMRNQMETPMPNSDMKLVPQTATTITSSNVGDGDSSSVPASGIEKHLPAPPTSAATSTSDKPPFVLTFRKPKPRPRSIITNQSRGYSLPRSTVSTPNPTAAETLPQNAEVERALEISNDKCGNDANNNNEAKINADNNNNNDMCGSPQQECKEMNNNEVFKTKDVCSKDKLPKYVFSVNDVTTKGTKIQVLQAQVDTGAGIQIAPEPERVTRPVTYEPDESFWRSDTTEEDKPGNKKSVAQPGENTPTPRKTIIQENTVGTTTSYESGSGSGSYENSYQYPYQSESASMERSGEQSPVPYSYGGTVPQSNSPFLITEKGAIRFQLPGRIQHKTTIKVAHFPTGEEKNVILNVKPDKEDDDCCVPLCANNQNFVVPPCPCPSPYGSYPYPYGGGGYPYSSYYGYSGYPPYY